MANNWKITESEAAIAQKCLDNAIKAGATGAKVALTKSVGDTQGLLNGDLDKVTHLAERVIFLTVFVDGRGGSFATNRLDEESLEVFVKSSVDNTKLLAQDEFRKLPDPSRYTDKAKTGLELDIYDETYEGMEPEGRFKIVSAASCFKDIVPDGYELISEETEYADSAADYLLIDSQGLNCRRRESCFDISSEVTIADKDGNKYSGYSWASAPHFADFNYEGLAREALKRAIAQVGPKEVPSGKYNMIVDTEVASKVVSPLLSALSGSGLQQNNSFLIDSLGKKMFHEGVTFMDLPISPGCIGARFNDSEGVATKNGPIIENGVVKMYFLNTYMAGKMGMEPTISDYSRVSVKPYGPCEDKDSMMASLGEGILVTGFNGGNCNSATGDFSYGIEGFYFKDGKIEFPVKEMLITGNFISLWNNFLAAGSDSRPYLPSEIPSLAFASVDFSA